LWVAVVGLVVQVLAVDLTRAGPAGRAEFDGHRVGLPCGTGRCRSR